MNVLTFDIEEWFLDYSKGLGTREKNARYDNYLHEILDALDRNHIKATFFCVGQMGVLFPEVVKLIHNHGHEIGCHSNSHTWLNKMTLAECREDTRCAVDNLEQCIGEKVKSYRAPAFSIGNTNKWAFEVLAENGIERDTSIFPVARSFGGFAHFGQKAPCIVEYNGIHIKEFPVCTTKVLGKETAYSGGGYFRFFPLSFVEKRMRKNPYAICYFHISDLVTELRGFQSKAEYEAYFQERGTLKARCMRYVKGNLGKKNALSKMMRLIDEMDFISLIQADEIIDWSTSQIVKL